jgi:hypothetical protein
MTKSRAWSYEFRLLPDGRQQWTPLADDPLDEILLTAPFDVCDTAEKLRKAGYTSGGQQSTSDTVRVWELDRIADYTCELAKSYRFLVELTPCFNNGYFILLPDVPELLAVGPQLAAFIQFNEVAEMTEFATPFFRKAAK